MKKWQRPNPQDIGAHRREPRDRSRDGEALFPRGLAGHHLFAPGLRGGLPMAGRTGRPHQGRPCRCRGCRHRRLGYLSSAGSQWRQADRTCQQCRHLAKDGRWQPHELHRYADACLARCLPGQFLRADHAGARPVQGTGGRQGLHRQCHFDCRNACASLRRHRLRHVQGRFGLAHSRNGGGLRPARYQGQRDCAGRDRHRVPSPGTDKIVETIARRRLGSTAEVADIIYFLCSDQASYVTGGEITSMAASTSDGQIGSPATSGDENLIV